MSEVTAQVPEVEEKIEEKKMQKGKCECGAPVGVKKGQPVVFSVITRLGQCVKCHITQWGAPTGGKLGRSARH